MKTTKTTTAKIAMLIVFCLTINLSIAQVLDLQTAGTNRWGRVNPVPGFNANAIGIGNFTTLPNAALHVNTNLLTPTTGVGAFQLGEVFRTNGPAANINAWRLFTGAGNGTEKFSLFVPANSNNVVMQTLQPNSDIIYRTGGANERMRIQSRPLFLGGMNFDVARVTISEDPGNPITVPLSLVHIGFNAPGVGNTGGGSRNWMDVGHYISAGSDNMYIGLLNRDAPGSTWWGDHNDAIINWGNNPLPGGNADRLRFIFTSPLGGTLNSGTNNGLEIARMATDGINGRTGFGGDPNIPNLYSTGSQNPQNTVEINSPATSNIPGQSGLRFTDLTSTSNIVGNPGNGVLSVNNIGDVILVPGGGTVTNANNGTSISGGNTVVLGNIMGGNAAQLLNDREIPMNDWNLVFTLPGTPNSLKNRVGFGTSNPGAEVEIYSVNGAYVGNTLPIVKNGGNAAAGWQYKGGGIGSKNWIVHTTGQGNYQGVGKFIFHVDSTDIVTMLPPTTPHMANPDGKVGILTDYPNNTLEINAPGATNVIGGSSGLRLTNLTTASPTTPNTGLGVLSVDINGDVVYVPASTGTGTGLGTCASPSTFAPFVHGAIDLQNVNRFYFLGNGVANLNNIGMGYPCSYNVPAKLSVYQTAYTTNQFNAIKVVEAGHFWANSTLSNVNYSFGVIGLASSTYGSNFGVYGESSPIGIASATNTNWAGYFNGAVYYGTAYTPSDSIIKREITPIDDAISIVNNLKPVSFLFDTAVANNNGLYLPGNKQFGFTAQDIEPILPELITTVIKPAEYDSLNNISKPEYSFKAINYNAFIPITIQAVKQLDSITTDLSMHSITQASNGCNIINGNNIEFGTNALKHDTKLPLNEYSLSFEDPQNSVQGKNLFRIGDITNSTKAKFTVDNNTEYINGLFRSYKQTPFSENIALMADINFTAPKKYAGYFSAMGDGEANFGIYTTASKGKTNYGIYSSAPGKYPTDVAGYFVGDVYTSGNYIGSDAMLKQNIAPITNAMSIINQLQPKTFNFDTINYARLSLPIGNQYGLIAQDVETILPDLVKEVVQPAVYDTLGNIVDSSLTFKALKYESFIPVLLQGAKELQNTNNALESKIDSLENIITSYESRLSSIESILSLCCTQNKSASQTDVNATIEISTDPSLNKQTQLYQNRPNPFNAKTTFAYSLGEGGHVELIIEDSFGRMVKTVVNENQVPGEYSIDWYAESLTSGIYFYSLKVNGIVLVKKAIKF